jgi:hypothetical protein
MANLACRSTKHVAAQAILTTSITTRSGVPQITVRCRHTQNSIVRQT